MDVAMLFAAFLLVFTTNICTCHSSETQMPDLYSHFLQTAGLEEIVYPPNGSRRPTPSDHLPIDDLLENESEIYDPQPSDINVKLLRRQLGSSFDKDYMSIKDPSNRTHEKQQIQSINHRPKGKRHNLLMSIIRRAHLKDNRKMRLSQKELRKLDKLISNVTFCPVEHSWKFLGIRFFPQWIKVGACTSKHSCSIPEGMMCKHTSSTDKEILRWHCRDFKTRDFCKWIHILYPIITECACAC